MIPSQKIIIMTKDRDLSRSFVIIMIFYNDLRNSSSQERQSKHKKRRKRKWELGENGKPSCALPPQQTSMWWRAAPRKPDYNFNRSRLDLRSFKKSTLLSLSASASTRLFSSTWWTVASKSNISSTPLTISQLRHLPANPQNQWDLGK